MTSAEARIAPRPRPFGRYSLRLAIWPVTAVVAAYVILLQVRDGTVVAEVVAAASLGILFAAPVANVVGLVLGAMAMFRSGDRKVMAVFGIILNLIVILFVAMVMFFGARAMVSFR
jgi:hypothetical protein